jgi:hypothetical protein
MIRAWEPEADDRLVENQVDPRIKRQEVPHRTGRPSLRDAALTPEESRELVDKMAGEYA